MFISEIQTVPPAVFITALQQKVYETLNTLGVPFARVDTDVAISMDDCKAINETLGVSMVKTLFLCNAQKTRFYLFVTQGDKALNSKAFSHALECSRVSFAPAAILEEKLGVQIGAATIFSKLLDAENAVQVVLDEDVIADPWYGCSDGTTVGYMKLKTQDVLESLFPSLHHSPVIIRM